MIICYGNQNPLVTYYDYNAMEYTLAYATMHIPKLIKEMIPEYKALNIDDFDRGAKLQIDLFDDLYQARGKIMRPQFEQTVMAGKTLAGCTMSVDAYLHRICVSLGGQGQYEKDGPIVAGPIYVSNIIETYVHEFIHVLQTFSGRSVQMFDSSCVFDGVKYTYTDLEYMEAPWEVEAFRYTKPITDRLYELFNEVIIANDKTNKLDHNFIEHIENLTIREEEYIKRFKAKRTKKEVDNPS